MCWKGAEGFIHTLASQLRNGTKYQWKQRSAPSSLHILCATCNAALSSLEIHFLYLLLYNWRRYANVFLDYLQPSSHLHTESSKSTKSNHGRAVSVPMLSDEQKQSLAALVVTIICALICLHVLRLMLDFISSFVTVEVGGSIFDDPPPQTGPNIAATPPECAGVPKRVRTPKDASRPVPGPVKTPLKDASTRVPRPLKTPPEDGSTQVPKLVVTSPEEADKPVPKLVVTRPRDRGLSRDELWALRKASPWMKPLWAEEGLTIPLPSRVKDLRRALQPQAQRPQPRAPRLAPVYISDDDIPPWVL